MLLITCGRQSFEGGKDDGVLMFLLEMMFHSSDVLLQYYDSSKNNVIIMCHVVHEGALPWREIEEEFEKRVRNEQQ